MFDVEVMGNSTFLIYKSDEKNIDFFGLGMLMNNDIEGFLPFTCVQKDENKILNYNITSMIPLGQYMENYLSKNQVIHIFKSITKGIISSEEYMLNIHKLLLDKNYIYIDVNGEICKLLYLPEKSVYSEISLTDFFRKIFMELRYDSNDNNAYVTEFINYFNVNPQLDCRKFEQWLTDMLADDRQKAPHMVKTDMGRSTKPAGGAEFNAGAREDHFAGAGENHFAGVQENRFAGAQENNFAQKNINENVDASAISMVADTDKPVKENRHKLFSLGNTKKVNKEQEKADKKQEKQLKKEKKKNKAENEEKSGGVMPYFAIPNMNEAPNMPKAPVTPKEPITPKAPAATKKPNLPKSPFLSKASVTPKEEMKGINENNFASVQNNMQNSPQNMAVEMPNVSGGGKLDFGDTVMSSEGECTTTLICSSDNRLSDAKPYLKRIKNGQKKYIDKSVIRIGRMEDYVDLYIGDNPFIARTHADIINENNVCYIRDNNSKNHTYVDERMLLGGEKVKLEHGMKISLANEEFVFYEY